MLQTAVVVHPPATPAEIARRTDLARQHGVALLYKILEQNGTTVVEIDGTVYTITVQRPPRKPDPPPKK